MKRLLWFLIFAAVVACFERDGSGQNPVQFQPTPIDPTGQACGANRGNLKTPDGKLYTCQNGTMAQVAGGGGGGGGTIGGAVTGGTPNFNLIVDGAGNLGQEATLGAVRFPAMLGDVQNTAGSLTNTIQPATVTLAKMANLAANSFIGNNTGAGATPIALTIGQSKTLLAIACADLTNAAASCATDATNAGNISSGLLALARGGTNAGLTASNGGIFYSTASAGAILGGTATANQALLSGSSAAPAWSTATYPATTTINQILYSSAANTIVGLATANNAVLVTSAGGVPSVAAPTAPLAVSASALTCATCATTTNGGALSATQPITISAAGVIAANAVTGTGNTIVEATSPTITTPAITTSETLSNNAIGGTPSDSYIIQNTTAAANNAQQYSPSLVFTGAGWKTNATAASITANWKIYLRPAQGTVNPQSALHFEPFLGGTSPNTQNTVEFCALSSSTSPSLAFVDTANSLNGGCTPTGSGGGTGLGSPASSVINAILNGTDTTTWWSAGYGVNGTKLLGFCATACGASPTLDTAFGRNALGVMEINNGTTGTFRDLKYRTENLTGLTATYNNLATAGNGVSSIYAAVATTGSVASIGTTNLQCGGAVCPAGQYRVHVYDVVTVTGTGTLTSTIGWNDGTAARTQVSTGIATTATNFEQVTYDLRADGVNNITYATTLSVSGTYSIYVSLERLQ